MTINDCLSRPAIFYTHLWSKHRIQLSQQMRARKGDIEVQLLLYAIQKTTNFEKALAQKYSTTPYIEKVKHHPYTCPMHVQQCHVLCGHTSVRRHSYVCTVRT